MLFARGDHEYHQYVKTLKNGWKIDENYLNELHEENEHECVVESLEIVKTHIYEKALRIGQKITYSDIFDFFFN